MSIFKSMNPLLLFLAANIAMVFLPFLIVFFIPGQLLFFALLMIFPLDYFIAKFTVKKLDENNKSDRQKQNSFSKRIFKDLGFFLGIACVLFCIYYLSIFFFSDIKNFSSKGWDDPYDLFSGKVVFMTFLVFYLPLFILYQLSLFSVIKNRDIFRKQREEPSKR